LRELNVCPNLAITPLYLLAGHPARPGTGR
jgi:hypothetical protein